MDEITEQTVSAIVAKARSVTPTADAFLAALKQPLLTEFSAWELWPLIGFARHERRQKWVGYIVESKLRGSGIELASSGAFAHPEEREQEGDVPDTPDWRYYFHGSGCCLQHTDGTSIDVDFAEDGSAIEIDPYFYSGFLASVAKPDWSDTRLRHPPPAENAWHFEIRRLKEIGLIEGQWRFRLTIKGRQLAERLEPIVDEINRLAQESSTIARITMSWLLTVLGDVAAAASILDDTQGDIAQAVGRAAASKVEERVTVLRESVRSADKSECKLALTALAALGRQYVEREVWHVLERTTPCSVHLASLRIVESWHDPSCESMLVAVLRRFAPPVGLFGNLLRKTAPEKDAIERPRNGLLVAASRIILSYHTQLSVSKPTVETIRHVLEGDRKACDSEAGFLLYLLSPALGLAKIRANIRNKVPITREEAASFLGMIGTDDAVNTLLEIAAGSAECGGHEAACMLSMLDDQRARGAAENWKRRNDGYDEAEGKEVEFNGRTVKTWSMDEVMRVNMQGAIQGCSKRLEREYGPLIAKWQRG